MINREYRVRFKRTVWVDTQVSASDKEEAMDRATEQADFDDMNHSSAEDTDFDVQELGDQHDVAEDGSC